MCCCNDRLTHPELARQFDYSDPVVTIFQIRKWATQITNQTDQYLKLWEEDELVLRKDINTESLTNFLKESTSAWVWVATLDSAHLLALIPEDNGYYRTMDIAGYTPSLARIKAEELKDCLTEANSHLIYGIQIFSFQPAAV